MPSAWARQRTLTALVGAVIALSSLSAAAAVEVGAVEALLSKPDRSEADRAADARRRPAETLAFAGVERGDRVLEFLSGEGYFTRLLADVVGPTGQVEVLELPAAANYPGYLDAVRRTVAAEPNARLTIARLSDLAPAGQFDVVVMIQGYHDLHTKFAEGEDIQAMTRALAGAIKPGGALVVIDHAARPGAGLEVAETLHRIDEADVVRELTAAGFVLEATSDVLRSPDDALEASVFAPAVRGRTDQFMLRFRKSVEP